MTHYAGADELFVRAADVLDRHRGIDAVRGEQIDPIALQRGLSWRSRRQMSFKGSDVAVPFEP